MSKLMSIFAAGALALSLGGMAFSAENTQDQPPTPADQTKQDQEYLAALKKCDAFQGTAKEKCIEDANKMHKRM